MLYKLRHKQDGSCIHANGVKENNMRKDYIDWLVEQKYSDNTRKSQLARVHKVEEAYGSLDEHFQNGTLDAVIKELVYSTKMGFCQNKNYSRLSSLLSLIPEASRNTFNLPRLAIFCRGLWPSS